MEIKGNEGKETKEHNDTLEKGNVVVKEEEKYGMKRTTSASVRISES